MSDEISDSDKEEVFNTNLGQEERQPAAPLSDDTKTETEIKIEEKEAKKEAKTKVKFNDASYLNKLMDTPKETPNSGNTLGDGNSGAKDRLLDSTAISDSSEDAGSDSDSTADLLVELVDWVIVSFIASWSLDGNDKEYQTDNAKKKVLKKYLSKWLATKQEQYPIEFFLIMAFLSTYFVSGRKAFINRKENKKKGVESSPSSGKKRKLRRTGESKDGK